MGAGPLGVSVLLPAIEVADEMVQCPKFLGRRKKHSRDKDEAKSLATRNAASEVVIYSATIGL